MARIALFVVIVLLDRMVDSTEDWKYDPNAYDGPTRWKEHHAGCNGHMQSPIDIQTGDVEAALYEPFRFIGGADGKKPGLIRSIENNGHTVKLSLNGSFHVAGGGLHTEYTILQAHFHWGESDDVGSEHKIDGKQFPLEMHVVSYAAGWFHNSVDEALNSGNHEAAAVLSVFFEISGEENTEFEEVITGVSNVVYQNDSYLFQKPVSLADLLPEDTSHFFRYNGSLTTPDCFEVVTWTVLANPVKISHAQMEAFRKLKEGSTHDGSHVIGNAFRPTQPIDGRTVYFSSAPPLRPVMTVVMISLLHYAYIMISL